MNYKTVARNTGRLIFSNPDALLWLIVSLWGIYFTVGQYNDEHKHPWLSTKAKLVDIDLSNRVRNKKPENYLALIYNFTVNNKVYEAYAESTLFTEANLESDKAWLYKTQGSRIIYYNNNDPTEWVFDFKDELTKEFMISFFITMAIVIALCLRSMIASYMKIKDE